MHTVRPDDGTTPGFWQDYQRQLGPDLALDPIERFAFYQPGGQAEPVPPRARTRTSSTR